MSFTASPTTKSKSWKDLRLEYSRHSGNPAACRLTKLTYMENQPKPISPPAQAVLSESEKILIHYFQAHLHIVVTAAQSGQSGRLAGLPEPGMLAFCRALAKLPDN